MLAQGDCARTRHRAPGPLESNVGMLGVIMGARGLIACACDALGSSPCPSAVVWADLARVAWHRARLVRGSCWRPPRPRTCLRRARRHAAGDPGRVLVDRRGVRDLDGHHLAEGRGTVGPPGRRAGDRHRRFARGARALSVRGWAEVEIVDGVLEDYLMAARKSMATEAAAAFEENCRKMNAQMAWIAITPSWVRFYDFGAGRMPRFLKDLADQAQS